MPETIFRETASSRPSLSGRLLLGLYLTVLVVMGVFAAWDYYVGWNTMLRQKRGALNEEATMLAEALEMFSDDPTGEVAQKYIDRACKTMQHSTSPGHHIAVKVNDTVIQAESLGRDSDPMWKSIKLGALQEDGVAQLGEDRIVVGEARRGELTVYVAARLSKLQGAIRGDLFRRVLNIVLLSLVILLVVHLGVHRFMVRPLHEMVEVVRRFGRGERQVRMSGRYPRELEIMAEEFDQMARDLEAAERDHVTRMNKARRVQENLHPDLGKVSGFDVNTLFNPADEVAGDFYDVHALSDGTTLFSMGDVTDHGVPAAMSAGMLKTSLDYALNDSCSPRDLLTAMNASFSRISLPEDFVTLILVRWNSQTGQIHYASAGHETCYLARREGSGVELVDLPSTGLVLGVQENATWREKSLNVSSGDLLVLLTDGIVEARSEDGEEFGRQRVQELLEQHGDRGGEQLVGCFQRSLDDHQPTPHQTDDITLLAAEQSD